jgi:hypothetical protein
MTVEHDEWEVETGSQGIDDTGHDIPVLTGQQMRQSALEGVEQEPDVFAGVEPMHGATPSVLGEYSDRAPTTPLRGRGSLLFGGKRCSRQDSAMKVGTLPDAERTQSITNLPFPTKPHVLD